MGVSGGGVDGGGVGGVGVGVGGGGGPALLASMLVANSDVLPFGVRVVAVTVAPHPTDGCATVPLPLPSATAVVRYVVPGP